MLHYMQQQLFTALNCNCTLNYFTVCGFFMIFRLKTILLLEHPNRWSGGVLKLVLAKPHCLTFYCFSYFSLLPLASLKFLLKLETNYSRCGVQTPVVQGRLTMSKLVLSVLLLCTLFVYRCFYIIS